VTPTANDAEHARAYLVFSQQQGPASLDAWDAHAARFFDARVGLVEAPRSDAAGHDLRVAVAPSKGESGVLTLYGRPREARDLALAEAAESARGGGGLALLARRCPSVWIVARRGEPDPLALLLSAIVASVLLGPILDPASPEIFGVKTARAKLAAMGG
jgi:hypothetical protein